MILIPAVVIVQQYFTRRRAIAAGIASAGVGCFGFIGSPLARVLVNTFGWRGAYLLFGGLSLQVMVPSALMRPLLPRPRKSCHGIQRDIPRKCWASRIKIIVAPYLKKKLFSRFYILYLTTAVSAEATMGAYYQRMTLVALSIDIDPVRSAVLPSIIAILTVIGRVISGFIAHYVPPHVIYWLSNTMAALTVLVVPTMPNTFMPHALCAAVYGLSAGKYLLHKKASDNTTHTTFSPYSISNSIKA